MLIRVSSKSRGHPPVCRLVLQEHRKSGSPSRAQLPPVDDSARLSLAARIVFGSTGRTFRESRRTLVSSAVTFRSKSSSRRTSPEISSGETSNQTSSSSIGPGWDPPRSRSGSMPSIPIRALSICDGEDVHAPNDQHVVGAPPPRCISAGVFDHMRTAHQSRVMSRVR